MISRGYEESDYRRGPPNVRNEPQYFGRGGRDEGDYSYRPPVYGRENTELLERYPQRADYGYRDIDQPLRGGSDVYRGYDGRGHPGAEQGYEAGRYAGASRSGAAPYDEAPAYRPRSFPAAYGQRGEAGHEDPVRYGAQERDRHEKSQQFDSDYHQWRDEQLNALDDDYRAWRGERYQKFADEFSQWRSGRARPEEESRGKGADKEGSGKSK